MIPLIGFIIAAYALTRLLQVPTEASMAQDDWLGFSRDGRLAFLALVSMAGFLAVLILTVMMANETDRFINVFDGKRLPMPTMTGK